MQQLGSTTPTQRRLHREWQRLRHRRDHLATVNAWHLLPGAIEDLDELVGAVHHTVRADLREARMRRLVELAGTDDLAARIVLQALLPELVHLARKRRSQGFRHADLGDLVATGWLIVRTFNPARRPVRLLGALVSDIDYREFRSPLRRKVASQSVEPTTFDLLAVADEPDAADELARLLADARAAGVPDDDLALARRLAAGCRTDDIGQELGVTARTIRNRRERVVLRLREVALAA